MKVHVSRNILLLFLFLTTIAQAQEDYTKLVDPNIGTAHSRWFFYTPAAVPFGMAKPAPATNAHYGNASGWEAVGYDHRHESIEGFPNLHEFQVGGIVFMASTGTLKTIPGKLETPEEGYRSRFDHKDEVAAPGYYSVILKDHGVKAELTSTQRVALHRYTFPAGKESHILFDIGNKQGESGNVKDAKVYITPDGRIEGFVTTLPAYVQKYQPGAVISMYFSAVVDKKPSAFGVFKDAVSRAGVTEETGPGAGLYLTFTTEEQESITIKAGFSYTSIDNARLNLQTEAKDLTFDQAKTQAHATWNSYLGRIRVEGKVREDKVKFYTGLFHALLGRGLASDVNGAYPKNDGTTGQIPLDKGKPIHNHYNTDAIWGAFWNLTQLWALAYPEYYSDFVKSQLLIYKDAGWLGDGIANSRYVSGVGTNFVSLAMAGAYMAGIRDFDVTEAYAASLRNEIDGKDRPRGAGKLDVDRFVKYGYVPHLDQGDNNMQETWMFSASHTLEYSFSAYAVAQWAKALGKKDDYEKLMRLSRGWEQLFDPALKLVRPKLANGQFIDDFKPGQPWRGFQEGNAWQYTFYVPHNPEALVQKIGRNEFNLRLDSIFRTSQKNAFGGGTTLDAFSGLSGLYNHGNQPNLHTAWLFNFSGRPSLTQKWVRAICNEFYGTTGIHGYGYGQDEDQGQLGAWYVIASMGLFDVKGLTDLKPALGIGSPLFDKVTIQLRAPYAFGKEFVIETQNNGGQQLYVQTIDLNGKSVSRPFIDLEDIRKGGKLTLQMGDRPKDNYK